MLNDLTGSVFPETARVNLTGQATAPVQLVVSADFSLTPGDSVPVRLMRADTILTGMPFEQSYSIEESLRFYLKLSNPNPSPAAVTVQVFIDSDRRYNRSQVLEADPLEFLEFVYTFR